MDAVDERFGLAAAPRLSDEGGHCLVGQQHELLDEFVGVFRFLEIHADGVACGVDLEAHLGAFKLYCSLGEALLAEGLGERVEGEYLGGVVALAGLDHLLCLLVGESAVGAGDGAGYLRADDACGGVHLEDDGECELLFVGSQ